MSIIIKINPSRIQTSTIIGIAKVLKRGDVIIYPTDTIYGIGCDAFNEKSVEQIFKIKKRSPKNPALVIVSNYSMVKELVKDIPENALQLMKKFWPGPLTIVFKAKEKINRLLVSSNNTIAIRIPRNNFCLKLLNEYRKPIVSTSANMSGESVPLQFDDLKKMFFEKVDLMVDGGDLKSSVPSTIIDVSQDKITLIREGAIQTEEIKRAIR